MHGEWERVEFVVVNRIYIDVNVNKYNSSGKLESVKLWLWTGTAYVQPSLSSNGKREKKVRKNQMFENFSHLTSMWGKAWEVHKLPFALCVPDGWTSEKMYDEQMVQAQCQMVQFKILDRLTSIDK